MYCNWYQIFVLFALCLKLRETVISSTNISVVSYEIQIRKYTNFGYGVVRVDVG